MKSKLSLLFFSLIVLLMTSCEREIDIDLPNSENLIVVEGSIEVGKAPIVLVTRNRGFFKDFPTDLEAYIEEFVITDAVVEVSDGTFSETLQFTINPNAYPFVYYTGSSMIGQIGKSYTITINAENQQVRGLTQIAPPVPIDSAWFGFNPFDVNEDSLGVVYVSLMDPDTFGNAYRLFSKRNSEFAFYPVGGSAFDDQFVNNQRVTFFAGRSEQPFATSDTFIPKQFFYQLGDTIFLKLASIGRKEYDFYSTLDAAINSNGNPFASPVIVKSNIEGGLGIWVGMSVSYDTLIATN